MIFLIIIFGIVNFGFVVAFQLGFVI